MKRKNDGAQSATALSSHYFTYLKSRSPIHASKFNSPRISSTIISRALLRHVVLAAKILTLI
jgi:hypothetical protein